MSKIFDFKKGFAFSAALYIVAGLVLLACPEITTKTIAYAVAVIFLVMGITEIVNYFRMEPSIASTSTGIVIVFNPFKTMIVLMRVMGIGLLVSGISDLCASVFMNRQFKKYEKKED